MLHICIPVYNEAPTIGVLLWRIRKVFQEYAREYEIVVYDDGSDDATAETIEPYRKVLPLTVLRGQGHVGYAGAVEALVRHVAKRTRYPRRDAMILMQGDFTEQPEHLPELVKRFEGGADIVVGELPQTSAGPQPVRRLRRVAPWVLRPFVAVPGVADLVSSFRLFRLQVLRDLVKASGTEPLLQREGWSANVELLLKAALLARRVESVSLERRYDLRPRESRVRPFNDAVDLYKFGWAVRRLPLSGRRAAAVPPVAQTAP